MPRTLADAAHAGTLTHCIRAADHPRVDAAETTVGRSGTGACESSPTASLGPPPSLTRLLAPRAPGHFSRAHPGHFSRALKTVPVLVAVYGATSQIGATGELRLQASDSSWITVDIDDRFFGWFFAYGHLRCGIGPGDDSVVQALYRMVSGVGSLRIKTISAYRMGNYVPAFV